MITKAIEKAFQNARKRGWDRTYWAVDIHDTAIKGTYVVGDIDREFFPHAKTVLQMLSDRPDVKLILYTCCHKHEIDQYLEHFEQNGIHFDYINENPEVRTDLNGYGNYDKKPYFNVLLEDKAGFDPYVDWMLIMKFLLDENLKKFNKKGE